MPDFDDAVGDMVTDLHAEAGRPFTYRRGGVSAGRVVLSKHQQPSQVVDNGQGGLIEVFPIDFMAKTSELPFNPPLRGDKVVDDIDATTLQSLPAPVAVYEVLPTVSEKVLRRISPQMTRLHTKQVAN